MDNSYQEDDEIEIVGDTEMDKKNAEKLDKNFSKKMDQNFLYSGWRVVRPATPFYYLQIF